MTIIKNQESLDAAIRCTEVVAKAMTAAAVYPQSGTIYQEYEKCILTLSTSPTAWPKMRLSQKPPLSRPNSPTLVVQMALRYR